MKHKEPVALFLVGALLSGLVATGAAEAGSAADPLIALNWLQKTFIPGTVSDAKEHVDSRLEETADWLEALGISGVELRVKRGDVLQLSSGSNVMPLAGEFTVSAKPGDVVDMTAGEELPSSDLFLSTEHRYLVTQSAQSVFSVASDTGVLRIMGSYHIEPSAEIDYNAMADALKAMGLFRGSDVPYGSGYDLERAPARIQGLVMFLRLIGEEQLALSYPGSGITFADVPEWALPYVAFAYDRGYTKGQEIDNQWRVVFGSDQPLAARDYVTFLLRALGHSEGTDFTWETALSDAQRLGVLTEGEVSLLTEKPFLRAQVVYLSYIALSANIAGESGTLLDKLISAGAVSATAASSSMANLADQRL